MAGAGACVLAGLAYSLVLLLPPAGWVLPAADSYAHYATLPIGLWTLAALIELAQRSLPVAGLATAAGAGEEPGGDPEPAEGEAGSDDEEGLAQSSTRPGIAGVDA